MRILYKKDKDVTSQHGPLKPSTQKLIRFSLCSTLDSTVWLHWVRVCFLTLLPHNRKCDHGSCVLNFINRKELVECFSGSRLQKIQWSVLIGSTWVNFYIIASQRYVYVQVDNFYSNHMTGMRKNGHFNGEGLNFSR